MGPTKKTVAAGIYVRISSDPELTRLGVKRQEKDCREFAKRRGWTVVDVYEDNDLSAYSGKVRPRYRQLLEDVGAGRIQAIVAWHPDRMHRHPRDLEEFIEVVEKAGCIVETVRAGQVDLATPTGRGVARIVGAMSRMESEHKADRQLRKHQELAAAGKDAGGGRPFGYDDDRMTIRPDEASLIRDAVQRVLAGESIRSICRDWTAQGVPTVTGATWSAQVMGRMLASARISGRREHRGDSKKKIIGKITNDHAVWPAIISADVSDRIRARLSDPTRRTNTYARAYLLTGGTARCGLCGKPLVSRPRGDHRRSMVCASGPGFNGCGKIRTLADPIEDLIAEAVLQAVDGGALAAAMTKHDDDNGASEGLLAIDAKLAELANDWAQDRITRGEWQAARGALEARRAGLQRRVDVQWRSHDLDGLPDPLRAAWPALPMFKRRAIVQALIEAVDVAPAVRGRNFFEASRVTVRWKV